MYICVLAHYKEDGYMDLKENKYVFIGMIIFVVPMLMFMFEMLGRVWG